jgi:4-hydroxybenzoate polyprenyltransferase
MSGLRACLELARLSNAPTCVTNVLVGAALVTTATNESGSVPGLPWVRVALVSIAIVALYVAGMVLNDLLDLEVDRAERPGRPLPSGRVSIAVAWMIVIACSAIALGVLVLLGIPAVVAGVALLATIVGYDAVHKRLAASVVLMGLCRSLVYVVAAVACTWPIDDLAVRTRLIAFAATMGAYIIGLSVVARLEAAPDGAPKKWPALVLPAIVGVPLIVFEPNRPAQFVIAYVVTTLWLVAAARHAMARPPRVPAAVMAWLAGICLVDATFLVHLGYWPVALIAVACFGLTRWGHRYILGS